MRVRARAGPPHGGLDNHAVGGKDSPVSDSPVSDSGHARHAPGTTVWHRARSVDDRGDTVCVIGAGASGLLAVKNLVEHGFAVDCYERETGVGGAWNWRHDRSPVAAHTHLVTSREATQIPDFPMPDSWPDYPDHRQMLSYLERYADHFGLRRYVWFGTEVVRVEPADDDRWDVTIRSTGGGAERTHRYAGVVVATGHLWAPLTPSYEGQDRFAGEVVHAATVKDPTVLRDRRVLVVGGGNTGCDLAVEASRRAAACWHSTRRGYWYLPKYLLGRPVHQVAALAWALRLPVWLQQWLGHRLLRWSAGDLTRFGLPAPDHKLFQTLPIVNGELLHAIGHGRLAPVPDVARFHPESVELVDGTSIDPDLVVFATGYLPRFEFLASDLLGVEDGRPHLLLHTFSRRSPTLALVGLLEPDAGLLPLVHWQTVAVARWWRRRQRDPVAAAAAWERVTGAPEPRLTRTRTKDTSRHWFAVSQPVYLTALERTLRRLEATR